MTIDHPAFRGCLSAGESMAQAVRRSEDLSAAGRPAFFEEEARGIASYHPKHAPRKSHFFKGRPHTSSYLWTGRKLERERSGSAWRMKQAQPYDVVADWRTLVHFCLLGLCIMGFLHVTGCSVGPDFVRPKPPAVTQYTREPGTNETVSADGQAQRFEPSEKIAADWWRLFNSPKLDMVVKEAIAENQNLQAALARLRQSQENLRAGYGTFFPQVDASFDATRQKFSPARFGSGASSSIFNLYTATATVTYVLDIFGGQRRTVESLAAQVDFQRYTAQATHLTLLGNVVNAAIAQAAYWEEIEATEQIIAFEKDQLRIAEVQARAGTVPYANVLSIRAQLAATEAALPPLRQTLSQTQHLLAALVGRTPAEWGQLPLDLTDLTLPAELPVTLPSELVRQRPDILAAEAQMHSASATIGVATAAMFPNLTLNGDYGYNSVDITKLFENAGNFWGMGAHVAAPIFHAGTLWFQRRAAIEAYQASLASYRQVVVSAFQQVADTLRAVEHDAETLQAQSEALAAADQALRLVTANYEAGLVNYLQILKADSQYQQARLGYIQARAQRLQDSAALLVALGGGWWNAETKLAGK
jgi:NodT family efflux transporter outer membrane factor (OMF) lipoprotein